MDGLVARLHVAGSRRELAAAGGLCISGEVHNQVRQKLEMSFEDLGEREVKNIPDPVRVYRVKVT